MDAKVLPILAMVDTSYQQFIHISTWYTFISVAIYWVTVLQVRQSAPTKSFLVQSTPLDKELKVIIGNIIEVPEKEAKGMDLWERGTQIPI